jgi:hypothetical protein
MAEGRARTQPEHFTAKVAKTAKARQVSSGLEAGSGPEVTAGLSSLVVISH